MIYKHKPTEIDACKYQPGMEHGFGCSEQREAICRTESGLAWRRKDCIDCAGRMPYLQTEHGRELILEGDYISTYENGDRHVIAKEYLEKYYEPCEKPARGGKKDA